MRRLAWLVALGSREVEPAPVAPVEAALECPPPGPDGHELFLRSWVPYDPRAPDGDGLGPVSNAESCAVCHQEGGLGGAGGRHTNVVARPEAAPQTTTGSAGMFLEAISGANLPGDRSGVVPPRPREQRHIDPSPFGISDVVPFGPGRSERNPPALFGAGLLDGVAEGDLIAEAALGVYDHPEITGRVARDERGRATRFGWKGQTATLAEFVERACSNELGLETAVVAQAGGGAPGPDLDDEQLEALTAFVAALPRPVQLAVPGAAHGHDVFDAIGCTGCHAERVGEVEGAYSDLLLHDVGPLLVDEDRGYGTSRTPGPAFAGAATPREWRTPPLWGLRDSGPYLHDGRANRIDDAISAHAGEAERVMRDWRALSDQDQAAVLTFLQSLAAP